MDNIVEGSQSILLYYLPYQIALNDMPVVRAWPYNIKHSKFTLPAP